jgi:ABC-type phosphate transport system substrate-binding protein
MRNKTTRLAVGLGATGAVVLSLALGGSPANADYAPSATDVVGIGGDTPQYDLDFLANGDAQANLGVNAANNVNKLISFDATADGNGRQAYLNGSTLGTPAPLNPTIVLRAGTVPVQRTQSTTAGYNAIIADTGHKIDFIRAGRLPKASEQAGVPGGLRVVQLGTESLEIAVANTTNAPANLTVSDLLGIYKGTITTWNQIPGNEAGSTETIVPLIPPSTSVINTTLLADLKAANGGTTVTLASNVAIVEQNDPAAITNLPAAQARNALTPFSAARLDLYDTSYFHTPNTVFPGGPAISSGVHLVGGYASPLVHYVVFRQSDTAAGALPAWQPGSTKTWVTALFLGTTSFAKSPAGQALVATAGITPAYADLGTSSAG